MNRNKLDEGLEGPDWGSRLPVRLTGCDTVRRGLEVV